MALTPEGTPYVESTDLVANYPAASLSLANRVDLVGVLPFATSAARATAIPSPTDGQYSYLQDTNATEFWNGSAWQAVAGGKILQVIRATSATQQSTTSTSFVDTNISVTITPQKNTSAVIVIHSALIAPRTTLGFLQITDASNNTLSGAESMRFEQPSDQASVVIGYSTPATTSAVTYKVRYKVNSGGQFYLENNISTGQLYAIEVAA